MIAEYVLKIKGKKKLKMQKRGSVFGAILGMKLPFEANRAKAHSGQGGVVEAIQFQRLSLLLMHLCNAKVM